VCNDCNKYYIVESNGKACLRLSGHSKNIVIFKNKIKNAVKNFNKQTVIAMHYNCSKHTIPAFQKGFFERSKNALNVPTRS